MQDWHVMLLGRRRLPRDLSAFAREAFFTFVRGERRAIEERRQPVLKLGLALQMGFLRMTSRPLEAVGAVPPALWQHLGVQLQVTAPDLASLQVMYRRLSTLYEHQELAREVLGFREVSEAQRHALLRALRDELGQTGDRERLRTFARRWLDEHRLIVPRERELRRMVLQALRRHESELAEAIRREIEPLRLAEWSATLNRPRESGTTTQTWLWTVPAKHPTQQIEEVLARVECLYGPGVDRQLRDVPERNCSVSRTHRWLTERTRGHQQNVQRPQHNSSPCLIDRVHAIALNLVAFGRATQHSRGALPCPRAAVRDLFRWPVYSGRRPKQPGDAADDRMPDMAQNRVETERVGCSRRRCRCRRTH